MRYLSRQLLHMMYHVLPAMPPSPQLPAQPPQNCPRLLYPLPPAGWPHPGWAVLMWYVMGLGWLTPHSSQTDSGSG